MGMKERIIWKLENDLEILGGHINLEELSEEEREKCFIRFGEKDENLTRFLRTAYVHGAPSIYCCSGHGVRSAYVVLKVTDENIELLRKVGKVLFKDGVATNFEDDYLKGKCVDFRKVKSISTEWLDMASQIMEEPELFDDSNPDIYYHETMLKTYNPFVFRLKKKFLAYLRGDKKELSACKKYEDKENSASWKLSEEEKARINESAREIAKNMKEEASREGSEEEITK